MATAKKAPAKKASKSKAVAKKPAAKKAVKKESVELKVRVEEFVEDVKSRAKDVQEQGEKAGLAYLGLFGKAYDMVQEQYNKLVDERDTRVEELVKRGEALREETKDRFDNIDMPAFNSESMKEQLESMKESMEEMREKMNSSFDNIKEKVAPAS